MDCFKEKADLILNLDQQPKQTCSESCLQQDQDAVRCLSKGLPSSIDDSLFCCIQPPDIARARAVLQLLKELCRKRNPERPDA